MQLRLLGPIEVVDTAGVPVDVGGPKERAVLAVLGMRAGQVVSEDALIDALWADVAPRTATKTLQAYISRLRRNLAGEIGLAIESRRPGYVLRAEPASIDLQQLDLLVADAARAAAAEDPAAAAAALRAAERLWRGRSLGEFADEPFAQAEAARLDEVRLAVFGDRVDAELVLGRHQELIGELDAACKDHPLQERVWAQRMVALYRCGRQAEALSAYQRVRQTLADELGLDPGRELQELEQLILTQDPSLSAPAGVQEEAKAGLPDGVVTFLLTDIEGSSRLWEANAAGMARAVARHDERIAAVVAAHGGFVVKSRGEGDSTFSVFATVSHAAAAATELQEEWLVDPSPGEIALRVRMSLHTGEAELRDGDYFGTVVNRAARLRAIAHGGQILCSQATAQLLDDRVLSGGALRNLGAHRLQDLARPEIVFQLGSPSLPTDFPPLVSLDSRPHNLPVQLTTFIGRDEEMATVAQLLAGHRLVTLTGAAGCGKTRMALQVGAERLSSYADGVWFVDLAPLGDPDLLVQTVATAVGVREPPAAIMSALAGAQAGRSVSDLLVEHLRVRSLLLLLDNCEHLLDAVAQLSEALLRACPELRILATSREAIGVGGEVTWRVRSLAVPDSRADSVPAVRECESVRLFVDRARACLPAFELTDRDAAAVAQICRRLDGIPLAIELAASRVEMLTPSELASRLDDRFRVLTGGSRTGLERHQTLRAAIDWSYDALPRAERALLERLSVFVGGCTLEAAEAVCAGGEVEAEATFDLLSRLVAKSLVVIDRDARPARYRLLETIRQYARDKLSPDETTALRARQLDHCVAFARQAAPGVWGRDQMQWFDRLEDEEDNLRQALEWAIGTGDAANALRLVGDLGRFWMVRRRVDEGIRWTVAALELDAPDLPYLRAQALVSAALALVGYFGAYAEARQLSLESLELFHAAGTRRGTFWALHTVSVAALFQGEVEEAVSYGDEALAVARSTGHEGTLVYGLLNRADVAIAEGDFELVDTLLTEALPMLRRSNDKIALVRLLGIQGYVAIRAGRYADAVPFLEETVVQSRKIGDESAVVWALANLGCVTLVSGDLQAAGKWFDDARAAGADGAPSADLLHRVGEFGGPGDLGLEARKTARRSDVGLLEGLGLQQVEPTAKYEPPSAVIGDPGIESVFLDIFLLNGIAELAFAEGDIARAAVTFAQAMRRLAPADPVTTQHKPGSGQRGSYGSLLSQPSSARFSAGVGMPSWMSRVVSETPGTQEPGSLWAMPASGLWGRFGGMSDPTPTGLGPRLTDSAQKPALAMTTVDRIAANTGAPASATPSQSGSIGDRILVPSLVAGAAKVAVARNEHELAARLFGAAEKLRGVTARLHRQGRWILFEHLYGESVAMARSALGDTGFESAYAAGQQGAAAAIGDALEFLDGAAAT